MKLYIVRPGDSLFTIARRFGTTVEALAYDNQLADPNRLAVGRALVIEDDTPAGAWAGQRPPDTHTPASAGVPWPKRCRFLLTSSPLLTPWTKAAISLLQAVRT